jgi:O-antigen ligase/tetratricopeptide (TPR) repeat protein
MAHAPLLIFLAALVFSPLAFGTVEHWSTTILELLVGVAACAHFTAVWFFRRENFKVPGIAPLLLLLCLMLLQIVPLPPALLKILSPHSYAVYAPVAGFFDQGQWLPLSLNQKATIQEFLRISSYALAFILTVQLLNNPVVLKKTINIVIFLAVAIAFGAILQDVSSPDKIFWFRPIPANSHPFGPWINPNQFAGYIEMISPLSLALFLFYRPRVRSTETWREKIVSFFTQPESNRYFFYAFGTILLVLSVFVSLCRGGIISITLAGMVFLLLYKSKKLQRSSFALLLIVCCAFLAVSWFGWDIIIREFNNGFDTAGNIKDARLTLWKDTVAIIKDYPFFGSGFGTFQDIYPRYSTLNDNLIYDHAHNDYLEILTDGGLVGFLLVAWFVLAVLWHGWKKLRVRRDQYAILLGIGSISGIVAMLLHSVTDFNMHNGAVGYYFFFLCGLLISSVNVRFNYYPQGTLLKELSTRFNPGLVAGAAILLGLAAIVQTGISMAKTRYAEVRKVYISRQLADAHLQKLSSALQAAMKYDPFEGRYPFMMGTVQWFLKDKEKAQNFYLRAALDDPMEGAYLQRIGLLLSDEGKGKKLIEEGYARAQNKDDLAVNLAEWLIWKDRREEAGKIVRERLQARPQLMDRLLPLLESYAFSREELAGILPSSVDAWLQFGALREKIGDMEGAEFFTRNAIELLDKEKQVKPEWFQQLINFYRNQKQEEKVLEILRQAVEVVPNYAAFHIQLGEYYEKEGIVYRAKEEYERALMLETDGESAKSHLRRLGYADSY